MSEDPMNPEEDDVPSRWRARTIVRLRQFLGTLPNYDATRSDLDQTWEHTISMLMGDPKNLLMLEGIATGSDRIGPRHSRINVVLQLLANVMLQEVLVREIGTAADYLQENHIDDEDDGHPPF